MSAQINFPPITQGDTWVKTIQFDDEDGSPINLTGCKFHLQFKSDPFNVLYADLSSYNGKISVDNTTGTITLKMMPEDTAALKMRSMKYDLDLTWPNGQNDTVLSGKTQIIFQITTEYVAPSGFVMDFSKKTNSQNLGILIASLPTKEPSALEPQVLDFSKISNSGLASLFVNAVLPGRALTPSSPKLDFSIPNNSMYIAAIALGSPKHTPTAMNFSIRRNSQLIKVIA